MKDKVLSKLSQIKRSIGDVQRNQAKLMKKMEKLKEDCNRYFYDVDKCHYAVCTIDGAFPSMRV